MELADFLLARIAEDEAAARAATPGPWTVADNGEVKVDGGEDPYGYSHYVTCDREGLTCSVESRDADHIARWDPARVLAECRAKAAAIGAYRGAVKSRDALLDSGADAPLVTLAGTAVATLELVLPALAPPYASHPDYRQEWRP